MRPRSLRWAAVALAACSCACGSDGTSTSPSPGPTPGWREAVRLDAARPSPGWIGGFGLGLDATGGGLVAWADRLTGQIQASAWAPGQPFGPALDIALVPNARAVLAGAFPSAPTSPSGLVAIHGPAGLVAARLEGGRWRAAEQVTPAIPPGTFRGTPALATYGRAGAVLVWNEVTGQHVIWAARHTEAGWSAPEVIAAGPGNSTAVRVALDPNGSGFATWVGSNGFFVQRFEDALGWGRPELMPASLPTTLAALGRATRSLGGFEHPPEPVASASGEVLIGGRYRYSPGRGWRGLAPWVWREGFGSLPSLQSYALDRAGNVLGVWLGTASLTGGFDADTRLPYATRLAADGQPDAPLRLTRAEWRADWPAVAMNAAGSAQAAWTQTETGATWAVWSARYEPAGGWSTARPISAETVASQTPQVALAAAGDAVAAWIQGDGRDSWSVWAARYPR